MLKNSRGFHPKEASLNIDYLITNGSAVNTVLNGKSQFSVATGTHIGSVKLVAEPMPGSDELQSVDAENSLARYYMVTNDRIVTPADIKILCYFRAMENTTTIKTRISYVYDIRLFFSF